MKMQDTIRVDCDSCGKGITFRDGMTVRVDDLRYFGQQIKSAGIKEKTLSWQYGRPTSDVLNALVVGGWKLLTARNVDGQHAEFDTAVSIPRKARTRSLFATCPECADWIPPFSQSAARELARIRLATTGAADEEIEQLRAEIDRLRGVFDDIQRAASSEAVAS